MVQHLLSLKEFDSNWMNSVVSTISDNYADLSGRKNADRSAMRCNGDVRGFGA